MTKEFKLGKKDFRYFDFDAKDLIGRISNKFKW